MSPPTPSEARRDTRFSTWPFCKYDAQPEICHACGQSLIAGVGVADVLGLKAALEGQMQLSLLVTVSTVDTALVISVHSRAQHHTRIRRLGVLSARRHHAAPSGFRLLPWRPVANFIRLWQRVVYGSDMFNPTEEYANAAGAEEAQMYSLRGAEAVAMTAAHVVCDPHLTSQVKEHFAVAKLKQDN
ncbi:xaa-Arg dipeptidase-like [Syngnathoides biaculeatus]|uniref:xaa-Arg dipeptidase-like n=1 Tax=Syngnathoides biaculeatus TaxID=300417 RepID=UPI002ADE7FC4|nr:xaa-Arg dipeptidase-like [Syngnathoides biaculeatus]